MLRSLLVLLPIGVVVKIGEFWGGVAYRMRKRERLMCEAQIRFVKSKGYLRNSPDPETLTRSVFRHVGVFGAELMIIKKLLRRNADGSFRYIENDDEGITPELRDNCPNGVLALSGHLGCFELLAAHYASFGVKLTATGRELNYKFPNFVLNRYREQYGVEMIWRTDLMGVRRIIELYRSGQTITSLIDQDTALPSLFATFFGVPAAHPIGPIKLAIKKQARIVTSFIVRKGVEKHSCIVREVPYDPKDPNAEQKVLDTFSQRLQDLVTQYPEQWLWWHRRWRREPGVDYDANPDDLRSTDRYLKWLESENSAS